ncbi:MAG: class I SAM-dependent methyltransferase [Candidatus Woesearchaeota archaeon]
MKAIKVLLKDAEKVKKELISKKVLDLDYKAKKDSEHIYFGVKKSIKGYDLVEVELDKTKAKIKSLRDALKKELDKKELELVKTSYDVIGSIAILEIDDEIRSKEKLIANKLLEVNKTIKTVLRKDSKHEGKYRTQKFKWLSGEKTKETIHKENGVLIKLDVENVYFSPRLGNDRKRISELIEKNEEVVVVGSGCGPYPIVFSKLSKAKKIIGIEFNKKGHEYAFKNKELNKIHNVDFLLGDAKDKLKEIKEIDRIVLATPDNSADFYEESLKVVKKGGTIHYNAFCKKEEFKLLKQELEKKAKIHNKKIRISIVKNGQHAPYVFRISADIKVL